MTATIITCCVCGIRVWKLRTSAKYCSRKCMGIGERGKPKPHSAEHESRRLAAVRVAGAKRKGIPTGPRPPGVIEKMQAGLIEWENNNQTKKKEIAITNLPKDVAMEKNGNWRGGRTKEARDFYTRNSGRLVKWRRQVFTRDGHKCKDCGATERLECHHILPLQTTTEFAFHRANGVTLCHNCHVKTKSYAGRPRKDVHRGRPGNAYILVIPPQWQDYDTVGNWQIGTEGSVLVLVSDLRDEIYQQAVALHELVEAWLCKAAGVTQEAVDAFDMGPGKDLEEPGFDLRSPYHRQHCWADTAERLFIAAAGESWTEYDRTVGDHGARPEEAIPRTSEPDAAVL